MPARIGIEVQDNKAILAPVDDQVVEIIFLLLSNTKYAAFIFIPFEIFPAVAVNVFHSRIFNPYCWEREVFV